MQPAGKRRPGEQLTKDNFDDSDDEGQVGGVAASSWMSANSTTANAGTVFCFVSTTVLPASACLSVYLPAAQQGVDPGTWGKADAATMAKRKVIKVRRGGAAAAPTPTDATAAAPDAAAAAAGASSNPFAGVSLTAAAPAAAANPFAGVSMTAAVTGQVR